MQIHRRFFPEIMQDNDINYLAQLEGVVSSVDEFASLEITKVPEAYKFRLAPSLPKYTNMLLREILNFHNMFDIRVDLGKSIKTSSTINFSIEI
jgi:hypothetical protein